MKVYISTIVKSDDKILLVKEGKQNCYGKWNVPSGHLEENESILAGAMREVKEETGLDVKPTKLIGIYNNQYEGSNSIQFSFLAEVDTADDLSLDHQEILDAKWVNINEASSYDLRDTEYINDAIDRIKTCKLSTLDTLVIR
jgi:ADP-ribose pyrophosphatase YjhB (NUDIX family)